MKHKHAIGIAVRIKPYPWSRPETTKIVEIIPYIEEGYRVDPPVAGFRSWNSDEMEIADDPPTKEGVTCP